MPTHDKVIRTGPARATIRTPVVAIVLLCIAAAGMAWWALQSTRDRVAASTEMLRSHADFAATRFSSRVEGQLYVTALSLFTRAGVRGGTAASGAAPSAQSLIEAAAAIEQCACETLLRPAYAFRIDLQTKRVVSAGPVVLDSASIEWLDTGVRHILSMSPAGWTVGVLPALDPSSRHLAVTTSAGHSGALNAVYGIAVATAELSQSVFRPILASFPLLGGAADPGEPNDSVLAIRIADANNTDVFRTAAAPDPDLIGRYGRDVPWSSLKFEVSLRDRVADQLVARRVAAHSPWVMWTAVLIAVALFSAAIVLVWRNHAMSRIRTNVAATMSHELRTPLTQIMLYAETLERGADGPERARERAPGIILREARRLLHLVENVLEFARGDQRVPIGVESLSLAAIVADVLEAFEPISAAHRNTISLTTDEEILVRANRDAVRRMLRNLLDNAVRHGPAGRPVTVRIVRHEEFARTFVCDEGTSPLAVPVREAVNHGRPLPPRASANDGIGIGLSIVHDLAGRQGGRCGFEQSDAGGTCFYFDLPLSQDAA